jgi:hypothetical protein
MSETNDNTPPKEKIADPEEIVQSRRLNSIFDIRDDLRQHRKIILMEKYDNSGVSRFEALNGYRALANDYLMELEPLLEEYEQGEKILKKRDFGYAFIQPNYEILKSSNSAFGTKVRIHHKNGSETIAHQEPPTKQIRLTGLQSIWDTPDPLIVQLDIGKQHNNPVKSSRPIAVKDQFSVRTTDRFIRSMNMFLSEIGFELEPQEDKEPHQI